MPYRKNNKTVKRRHRKSQKGGWLARLTKSMTKPKSKSKTLHSSRKNNPI